ncbi:MAG: alpha/beta fold hydrolase [Myxococcota bacterium]|nr:alpha/beta fold hydrolase [Myxococcota bacterium]
MPVKPRRTIAKPPACERLASEIIEVKAADGWLLRAEIHEPEVARDHPLGVALLAHGVMAGRSEFDRPAGRGVVRLLAERGWRVVTFDFRGHGDSEPPAGGRTRCTYDDLVTGDLPALHAFARSRSPRKKPVILVGHSLGGHVALAAQGAGLVAFDGIAAIGSNIWLREFEPSPARWLVKRATLAAALTLSRKIGRFPARALGLGSDDENASYLEDLVRYSRTGAWTSADGRMDYLASLGRVRVPVLQVVSQGDHLACVPECGERFVARCGGPLETMRVSQADDGGPAPDHRALVTSERTRTIWHRIEGWMHRAVINTGSVLP